jgi:hypothetical protein
LPNAENLRKEKRKKKCPTNQNKKVKKWRDVDPEVWCKLGGIGTFIVSESKNGNSNFQ